MFSMCGAKYAAQWTQSERSAVPEDAIAFAFVSVASLCRTPQSETAKVRQRFKGSFEKGLYKDKPDRKPAAAPATEDVTNFGAVDDGPAPVASAAVAAARRTIAQEVGLGGLLLVALAAWARAAGDGAYVLLGAMGSCIAVSGVAMWWEATRGGSKELWIRLSFSLAGPITLIHSARALWGIALYSAADRHVLGAAVLALVLVVRCVRALGGWSALRATGDSAASSPEATQPPDKPTLEAAGS